MNFILFLNPRCELLSVLKQCLYNDPLAAEYLLLHLTSHIYGRQDVMAIGKFTLNITGCKILWFLEFNRLQNSNLDCKCNQSSKVVKLKNPSLGKRDPLFHSCLTSWITALNTKCFSLPLSLTNLNNVPMLPAKDYKANR